MAISQMRSGTTGPMTGSQRLLRRPPEPLEEDPGLGEERAGSRVGIVFAVVGLLLMVLGSLGGGGPFL